MITKLSNIGEGGPGGTFRTKLKRRAFRWLGPFRLGALLTSSHHLVLLSEVYRERLKAFWLARLPLARAVVIPPAPLLPIAKDPAHARCRGRSRLDVRDDEFVVSFFGRMYPGKGIEQLLGAAAELVPAHPRLRFALIGGVLSADHFWLTHHGYADTLLDLIEELGLVDRVVATGEYAWDSFEASEYLYASDVAVLPLSMGVHAYNSSFAAACAHGLPVIATRGRFVEGAFEHRQNIYFLDEASERCIADAIEEVMADDDLRGRLAAGSRDLAARLFDWDRSVDRLEELLEKGRK